MSLFTSLSRRALPRQRRWWVPEVIQTSVIDCGPASLKCLLEGFYIHASYERLREACQTAVDGTSIDMIESVARQLGLDAEQVMLPKDYLWMDEANALPALAVIQKPGRLTHFVIVWRRHGRWLQVMDPAVGRRWTTCSQFAAELFSHTVNVPAADWYEWATSGEALQTIIGRLQLLGASAGAADDLVARARQAGHWRSMAALDAAVRLLTSLIDAGGVRRGRQAMDLLGALLARTAREMPGTCTVIPELYWAVLPTSNAEDEELVLRGAVVLRVRGRLSVIPDCEQLIGAELQAVVTEPQVRPIRELWGLIRVDGLLSPLALMAALGLAVGGLVIEALLFRGLFDLAQGLGVASQRVVAFAALICFSMLLWAFEFPIAAESLRFGRRLEARLRLLLFQKLPRLSDRYFQSRPVSDVVERAHNIYLSRYLPDLALRVLRSCWDLMFTLVGIAFIDLRSLPLATVIAVFAASLLIATQPLLSDRDMRARAHAGALQGFYLDALLGIVPIRTHRAEPAVRREHEGLLTEWTRAAHGALRPALLVNAVQAAGCISLASWLLLRHVQAVGVTGNLLLLVYWVMRLPSLADNLATALSQYPTQRNVVLRLLEQIKAPEQASSQPQQATPEPSSRRQRPHLVVPPPAIAIEMEDVDVIAAGHTILQKVRLSIKPGEHVAVVGPSGAGKSTLLGLLLGWHQAASGRVLIDGGPLSDKRLLSLRAETAWLDPAVQLWNAPLLDNLRYCSTAGANSALGDILESADLIKMLVSLPQGLQTLLAEGGASVSGGEGQRIRLARAMWQQNVRLALLDEPFRGLDRERRQRHLVDVRRFWQEATMICVTHDVWTTQAFPRVLVVEDGRIVEDGCPEDLAAAVGSRYRHLLDVEESLRHGLWNATLWRRIRLEGGRVQEAGRVSLAARSAAGHE